ncbi:MAG: hypothetical protein M3041_10400 [Acidobacteriota bacterium]|nr:hypothetical protein [Acidobacteriota bacterium]
MSRVRLAVLIGACVLGTVDARAQAWLPAKDTTTLSFGYQYLFIKQHVLARGEIVERGHIKSHYGVMQLGYSPTDRVAFSLAVPYVAAKYHGPSPHQLPFDNGTYHGTWQDYRLDARYQLLRGPTAFTPFISMLIPSHNYTYFAHSAAGRDLHENTLGFYAGVADLLGHFRSCGCPTGTYVQSRVAYSLVEHVLGRRIDHADVDLDLGYFATERFGVRALASYGRTIGGVDWNYQWPDYNSPVFLHHDQLLANRHFNVGGGANYAVSDRFDVYTSVLHTLSGRNGHKIHVAANFGVGWSFAPRRSDIASLPLRSGRN